MPAEEDPGDARLVEILLFEIGFVVSHTDTLGWTLEELVPSMAWNAVLFDLALPDTYKASSPGWGFGPHPGCGVIDLGLVTSGLEDR